MTFHPGRLVGLQRLNRLIIEAGVSKGLLRVVLGLLPEVGVARNPLQDGVPRLQLLLLRFFTAFFVLSHDVFICVKVNG